MPALHDTSIKEVSPELSSLRDDRRDLHPLSPGPAAAPELSRTSTRFDLRRALAPPSVLDLQVSAGNRAVARLLSGRAGAGIGNDTGSRQKPESAIQVQRLLIPSGEEMQQLAGRLSTKAALKKSTYKQLLDELDEAARLKSNPERRREHLEAALKLANSWLAKRTNPKKTKLDADDRRQARFVEGLISDLNAELGKGIGTSNAEAVRPSDALRQRSELEGVAIQPDYHPSPPGESSKVTYHVVIGVYQQEEKFMALHEERTPSVIRSKFRSAVLDNAVNKKLNLFGTRTPKAEGGRELKKGLFHLAEPKTSEQTARKAARRVVDRSDDTKNLAEEEREKEIDRLAEQTGATGHTWVKLIKRVDGADNTVWSFGFWPLGGFGSPTKPVPGVVRHPDRVYEREASGVAYLPREVDKKAFDSALEEAAKISASHPDYTAAGYNCTTFVKDVISKAGLSMPSGHKILGLKTVHNPNTLYEAATSDASKQDKSSDIDAFDLAQQRMKQERSRQEQASRERAEQEEIDKHPKLKLAEGVDKISFWLGESFNSLEHSQEVWRSDFFDLAFRLADLDEEYTGLHPQAPGRQGENPFEVVWMKVLLVDGPRDKGKVGWVRKDEVVGA